MISKICSICSNEFMVKLSHFSKRVYCSRECMALAYQDRLVGESNPNWKNGISEFKESKRSLKPKIEKKCERCDKLFYVYESRRFQKFCSFDCKKVARICFYCEKPILKGGNKYCSSECRRAYYIIVKRCSVCFVEYTTDKKNPNKYCSEACYRKMQSLRQSGSGSHFWKGGMTDWKMRVRTHPLYKLWRKKVFERDGYTCQSCFKKSSEISKGKLTAHHIIPFKEAPKLALKSSNGITLCWQCHKDFHVFLRDGSLALKETSLKEQCLKFFKSEPGVYMFKIHGHNSQASGIPDFIGTVLGFFVAIELKIFPGFASPIQKFQIDRIKNANGKAFVCRSIGEVQKIIQMIKECF